MWLLVGIIAITILSIYFFARLGEDHPLFETFLFIIFSGVCIIPSLIIFIVLEHYDVVQEYKVFPITLPLFIMAGFALLAINSKTENSGSDDTADKKDITAEAIIMTTILSEDDDSKDSSSSGSSSSSSNSDDFFLL